EAVGLQADGKVVVAGYSFNGSNYDVVVARYTVAGQLDAAFGQGGVVRTAVGSLDEVAWDLAVQPDGKIVVVGYTQNTAGNDFLVIRYNVNGTLDSSFGGGGNVIAGGPIRQNGLAVALQAAGKNLF